MERVAEEKRGRTAVDDRGAELVPRRRSGCREARRRREQRRRRRHERGCLFEPGEEHARKGR